MLTLRASNERGHFNFGWLDTRHSFSFGDYHDPDHMGFRALRVINEDRIQPGQGFGTHPHRDMEILTWVLEGALEHRDSLGHGGVIRPGEAQRMSAGTGIFHSEFNASDSEPVHLLQIWILPQFKDLQPSYEQQFFPEEGRRGQLRLIASPDGRDGSLTLHQDAFVHASLLEPEAILRLHLDTGRHAWLQVARGRMNANGLGVAAGDGLALSQEGSLILEALEASEVLLFDLG